MALTALLVALVALIVSLRPRRARLTEVRAEDIPSSSGKRKPRVRDDAAAWMAEHRDAES